MSTSKSGYDVIGKCDEMSTRRPCSNTQAINPVSTFTWTSGHDQPGLQMKCTNNGLLNGRDGFDNDGYYCVRKTFTRSRLVLQTPVAIPIPIFP
jgi:hypothetical protein